MTVKQNKFSYNILQLQDTKSWPLAVCYQLILIWV